MKCISLTLAIASFGSGAVSAYYWYLASKVAISPAWEPQIQGDSIKNVMAWVTGSMIAFRKSAVLNQRAAIWTAITVASTTIANLFAAF